MPGWGHECQHCIRASFAGPHFEGYEHVREERNDVVTTEDGELEESIARVPMTLRSEYKVDSLRITAVERCWGPEVQRMEGKTGRLYICR